MYNYIPHPSNARQASMCVSLQIAEGFAGYGIYWAVLEVLRDAPGYRYSPDPKVWAYVLHAQDVAQVERVLTQYGLFTQDGDGLLYSPWLIEQLGAYDDKKAKLREAGRKGAQKRWSSMNDGQAIATPSMNDGQAIAILHNITQSDITLHDPTRHDRMTREEVDEILKEPGNKVTDELIESLSLIHPEGHNPGYLAQICRDYDMGENVLSALQRLTNNAEMVHPNYILLCNTLKAIQAKKWRPNMPSNYFLRKLTEI